MQSRRTGRPAILAEGTVETGAQEQQGDIAEEQVLVRLRDIGPEHARDDVQRQLDLALQGGPRSLAVEMSAIAQLSSTTIAELLGIRRRCSALGIELVLRRPSWRSLDALERAGLLAGLRVEPNSGSCRPWHLLGVARKR